MVTKVLMVCLGNICRSPLAEGILENKVDPKWVRVDSAGTAGYHEGEPPDARSIAVAAKYGIRIAHQKSRKLKLSDLDEFDVIYAMDRNNYHDIMALAKSGKQQRKVRLLLQENTKGIREVPDPYYGGPEGFENVFQLIDGACESIARQLKKAEK